MGGRKNYLRRWSRTVELTVVLVTVLGGATVAVTVKPGDSSSACAVLRYQSVSSSPAGLSFLSFFFLLLDCLSQFPCQYPRLFFVSQFRSFLSLHSRFLSLSFPFFSAVFFSLASFSLFCTRTVFIGAGGAGMTLPHPITAHAWGARRLLCHGADSGGQWRRRLRDTAALASHHEMGGVWLRL